MLRHTSEPSHTCRGMRDHMSWHTPFVHKYEYDTRFFLISHFLLVHTGACGHVRVRVTLLIVLY